MNEQPKSVLIINPLIDCLTKSALGFRCHNSAQLRRRSHPIQYVSKPCAADLLPAGNAGAPWRPADPSAAQRHHQAVHRAAARGAAVGGQLGHPAAQRELWGQWHLPVSPGRPSGRTKPRRTAPPRRHRYIAYFDSLSLWTMLYWCLPTRASIPHLYARFWLTSLLLT